MCTYCFICPTYGHYEYARAAVKSFFENTPNGVAIIVDDGHAEFHKFWDESWNVTAHHFKNSQGLTRSWNYGLAQARNMGAEYAICGNSDILFSPGWEVGPARLLADNSVALVGPLSNGPGLSNKQQNIWDHIAGYQPNDAKEDIMKVATELSQKYEATDCRVPRAINGFFMIGRTLRWWEGRFDDANIFHPHLRMGDEHELQKRFGQRGWKCLVSLRSYIFHYRSVTRGDKFKHGMWFRR